MSSIENWQKARGWLAHAKRTLNTRKFPKREQKIIVAYKGNTKNIGKFFSPVGRL